MSLNSPKWKAHEKLIERISKSILEGSVSHAYIIEGDAQSYKYEFAIDFLKAILCREEPGKGCDNCITCRKLEHGNYEDLYIVSAEFNQTKTAKSIKDEAIFKLQDDLAMKPLLERSLAIISDADLMTIRAQNRLLKTLEEPPVGTVIILLCSNKENLLETVRSRCISYRLNSLDEGKIEEGAEALVNAVIADALFFDIKNMVTKYAPDRECALSILDGMERIFRNIMISKDDRYKKIKRERVFRAIELIEEARSDIRLNVNFSYALKNLLIKL